MIKITDEEIIEGVNNILDDYYKDADSLEDFLNKPGPYFPIYWVTHGAPVKTEAERERIRQEGVKIKAISEWHERNNAKSRKTP